jgi:hypothetical protein
LVSFIEEQCERIRQQFAAGIADAMEDFASPPPPAEIGGELTPMPFAASDPGPGNDPKAAKKLAKVKKGTSNSVKKSAKPTPAQKAEKSKKPANDAWKGINLSKLDDYGDGQLGAARTKSAKKNIFSRDHFGEALQDEIDDRHRRKIISTTGKALAKGVKESLGAVTEGVGKGVNTVKEFADEHPNITAAAVAVGGAIVTAIPTGGASLVPIPVGGGVAAGALTVAGTAGTTEFALAGAAAGTAISSVVALSKRDSAGRSKKVGSSREPQVQKERKIDTPQTRNEFVKGKEKSGEWIKLHEKKGGRPTWQNKDKT